MRRASLGLVIAMLACGPVAAEAFDPLAFVSGGPFPSGPVTIDSTTMTVGGVDWPGAQLIAPPDGGAASVFTFDGDANVSGNVTLVGVRSVAILFRGAAAISGGWIVLAGQGTGSGTGISDPGGGTGGGGFGGAGGAGGLAPGGAAYGDLLSELRAGSNGGTSTGVGAALSGGAVEIGAIGLLDLSGASLLADGADGVTLDGEGLGGASGGGIFLHAFAVTLDASTTLSAHGGRGGDQNAGVFHYGYGGGGGGGGRIAVLWNEQGAFDQGGATIQLAGGIAGATIFGFPGPGGAGSFVSQSSPTIGVPEPCAAAGGGAALAALAWRARQARAAASSRSPACTA